MHKRFIIIAGKGGVGKTTIAAALGIAMARQGRRVLVTHVRSKQPLGLLYGVEENEKGTARVDETIQQVRANLWVVNMTPEAAIAEIGLMVLKFKSVYHAVFESKLAKYFVSAVPSLEEYSMVGKAWYHTTEQLDGRDKYDTVIFDGPATGHLISMLQIPQIILDIVPQGPLTADAEQVQQLLTDHRRTGAWIVSLAEEMPATESAELYAALTQRLGIAVDKLVVNGLYPQTYSESAFGATLDQLNRQLNHVDARSADLSALIKSAQTLRHRRQINDQCLGRLTQNISAPQLQLPQLFTPKMNFEAVSQLCFSIAEK